MNNNFNNDYTVFTPEQTQKQEPNRSDAIKAMVFGIIAAYFAWFPIFSILGIIFGVIAKNKGIKIMQANPSSRATHNFAKAGRITGKVGFIGGICMTAFYVLYFAIIFIAIASI